MPIEANTPVVIPAKSEVTYPYIGFNEITIKWPDPNGEATAVYAYRYFGQNPDTQVLEWASGVDNGTIQNLFAEAQSNPVIAGAMQLIFFELEGRVKNLGNRTTTDLATAIQTTLAAIETAKGA